MHFFEYGVKGKDEVWEEWIQVRENKRSKNAPTPHTCTDIKKDIKDEKYKRSHNRCTTNRETLK